MAVTLIFIGATLTIAVIAFMIARAYAGGYFDTESERVTNIDMAGLSGLSASGGMEMPTAAAYSLIAREWRNIQEVRVYAPCDLMDMHGDTCPYSCGHCDPVNLIVSAEPDGAVWRLTPELPESGGTAKKVSGPEMALHAVRSVGYDGVVADSLADFISGRIRIQVIQDLSTYNFIVVCQRLA
jgi:hypothetical protein